ncbi:MAG: URC4/urg3 family protein [Bradyrhizobium sp.]|uniref:URC4/urg3 family protein n=1 Tax=Bradyrhizobium sp. TaxID=376 RepID=UPI001E1348A2|nr:URC4/urg3 family protein [Bradyrhizobium sp.]MBV9562598.1 URC4/urg3 family protein [Bradyrhizobium sp.]
MPRDASDLSDPRSLLSAKAVRERSHCLLEMGLKDQLPHFRIDLARLDAIADLVLATTRQNYPSGDIPFHSRWRHFVSGGADRWAAIAGRARWPDAAAQARAEFDLAIVSVLLDAGAGPSWRYRDASGARVGRSEGLALASLDMFASGLFSADPNDPLRADAQALARLSVAELERGFQVGADNPLVGIDGRAALLRRLGDLLAARPDIFAGRDGARPGGLFDHLAAQARDGHIDAPTVLSELLSELGPIWPSRITLDGVALGDCWRHPALADGTATGELAPLHKLSQWMTYSLIEPLQRAGLVVDDVDGLTGLAEYRNGGLFVDGGVLSLRHAEDATRAHEVASPLIVEWRALTVALLDELAAKLRQRLGQDATSLPLAKILEGGTWATGRALAYERRPDGSPPLQVISDGTVF